MIRVRPAAAIAAIVSLTATLLVAVPAAQAAPTTLYDIDFEDSSLGSWSASGGDGSTLTYVDDDTKALSVARTADYVGIQSPTGEFEAGRTYTFSMRAKLADPAAGTTNIRFVMKPAYTWIGNTAINGDGWTTVTGELVIPADADTSAFQVYLGTDAASTAGETFTYLVDDITVTAAEVPPTVTTLYDIDFEDSSLGSWSASGGDSSTLTYVDDDTKALSVARTADYVGIQSPVGEFEPGTTYTFTMRAKLADPAAGTTNIRFVMKPAYTWIGNTAINGDGWTTVTGELVIPADADTSAFQVYLGTDAASTAGETFTYLVDDITVTYEAAEEPEPCTPTEASQYDVDFEDSSLGPWLASGGDGSTLTYVDDDSKALSVARTADYVGIQSPVGEFEAGTTYTFSMRAKLADAAAGTADIRFVMKPAYTWIGNTTINGDGWTTVTGQLAIPADADTSAFQVYLGTGAATVAGETYTYLIDDVAVTYTEPCSDGPEPGTVVIDTDFEDGLDGWVPREAGAGPHTVAITTTDVHGGLQAALVSDRTSQGSGIGIDVDGLLEPGVTYELSAWLKFAGTPTEDIVLSIQTGEAAFANLATFSGITDAEWVHVTGQFTFAAGDRAFLYFETPWEGADVTGNTTPFIVDDITVVVPEPPVIEDLTPIMETLPFPVGVAIDQRETLGSSADLLLKHFNQITPENYMKPEAFYDTEGNWAPNAAQIDSLMDFAQDNDLGLYGHVLVWHSQTPAFFFQDEAGQPLTTSEEDKQILRDRMREHIFNVAEYLSAWGEFGGGENPVIAFDVVNEVIDDSAAYDDGMRRSEWYRILGEEFVDLAFEYAEEAFNDEYAADAADRPVTLFINDYNTEQSGKRARYLDLVERLLTRGAPLDGIGHQFHVNLSMPVSNLEDAIVDASEYGLTQAVTELDVTTGVPESQAKFIDQGYYYRDAFEIFRDYSDQMFSVTVWGLIDSRSWRDANGGPLVFDDALQAKPAYYGIVEPAGTEDPLPPPLRTANSFAGSVAIEPGAGISPEWDRLPLLPAGPNAGFQTRWASDHLTVFVNVEDAAVDAADGVQIQVGDDSWTVGRDGSGLESAVVNETPDGYTVVAHVPLTSATEGATIEFDVRVVDDASTQGWNSPGVLGTVTLVEALSHLDISEAAVTPVIDGVRDQVWSSANSVTAAKNVSGTGGALGTFSALWQGPTLYLYAEIADPIVDVSGSDPWTQDSVEIYVDPGNAKNGAYRYDDTQIRINADNVVSFGTGDEAFQANRVESATTRVDGGYVVEVAISLLEYGGLGTIHGLDLQVNDAAAGARSAIRNWADPTGAGYQSTARWGVATLVASQPMEQAPFTPVILGNAVVGSTLTAAGLPAGTTLAYQWLRSGSVIDGATGPTYKLTTADAGKKISVRVTSVATGYVTRIETSAQTSVVLKKFAKTKRPIIIGAARVGHTVKAKVSSWSPSASFSYQWYSNGKAIKGASKSTYKVTRWVAGTNLTVKVTGKRTGYQTVTTSSSSRYVPRLHFTVRGATLSGPTRVGGTLKAVVGRTSVSTVKSFQWYNNGKAIKGATKSSYTLVRADQRDRITVKITYRATGYNTRSVIAGPSYRILPAR